MGAAGGGECNKAREGGSNPPVTRDMHSVTGLRRLAAGRECTPYTARLVTRRPMFGCLVEIVETLVLTLIIFFVIQTFVYPENWVEHLTWAAMLVFLLTRGPGPVSLDHLLKGWLFGNKGR